MRKILVIGSAGFIGFHLSKLLLANGFKVVGYESLMTNLKQVWDDSKIGSCCKCNTFGRRGIECRYGKTKKVKELHKEFGFTVWVLNGGLAQRRKKN